MLSATDDVRLSEDVAAFSSGIDAGATRVRDRRRRMKRQRLRVNRGCFDMLRVSDGGSLSEEPPSPQP
eukprot:3706443-Prymnesium_polylepis.2